MAKSATTKSSAKTAKNLKLMEKPGAEPLEDYRVAFMSRQASLIGRKEVLTGKAKFGIFGDGKEVAQLAMARVFKKGDWRGGYYRDQTFMFALGALSIRQFFAQLYADTNLENEPATGGRQMNSHFSTRYLDDQGEWLNQCMMYNSSADMSPTAGQMARLVGLAFASKLYRQNKGLADLAQYSVKGNEVAFGTIGNASTSEGVFWEAMNAVGVLQVPLVMSVWDDDYGISVPARYQTTKESISEIMAGFKPGSGKSGIDIYVVKGHDYPALLETYTAAVEKTRKYHTPSLIHVTELTQPQGHSTSGSHERYKSKERLELETQRDCILRMREWLIGQGLSTAPELDKLEEEASANVERERAQAWKDWEDPIKAKCKELQSIFQEFAGSEFEAAATAESKILERTPTLFQRSVLVSARKMVYEVRGAQHPAIAKLNTFVQHMSDECAEKFNSYLWSQSNHSPLKVKEVPKVYGDNPEKIMGFEVIGRFFENAMGRDPRIFIIGEDVGHLGGVSSEFKGLQDKFGEVRISDTGIREATILGQGIGAAMRGLKPIVDIQYLDYLLYCFQTISDDLATLHYRSAGGQAAPCIIRTKGHRLEGIWHTGSPMGTIIHGARGIHVCVPRDMVQAVGMYNTLLKGDDPALVIEVLNGYRIKEELPLNLGEYTIPLGVPEILQHGDDLTIVTYGACVRIVQEAVKMLEKMGVSIELIDAQTLLPFDRYHMVASSLEKTGALLIVDEDVPGGASAYLMQQILEDQKGYEYLDAPPRTLAAKAHRAAYASDGDYFSKPNAEDVVEMVYGMMRERSPGNFPEL